MQQCIITVAWPFLPLPLFIIDFPAQAINEAGATRASLVSPAQLQHIPRAGPSYTETEILHKNSMWSPMYNKGTKLRLPSNHLPTLCHKSLFFISSTNTCQACLTTWLSLVCFCDPNYPFSQRLLHRSFFVQPVPIFSHYSSCYPVFLLFVISILFIPSSYFPDQLSVCWHC